MPARSPTNFCKKFRTLLISNFQSLWQSAIPITVLMIFIFLLVIFALVYTPLAVTKFDTVKYLDLSRIYGSEE